MESLDVLVANLAFPPQPALVDAIEDGDWHALFDHLVHPLKGLLRGAAKRMKAAGGGRIIAVTSAALRGIPKNGAYCAARGAQNAFLRAAGLELARDHIAVAAIAQNYIENDTYYPPELLKDERFLSPHAWEVVSAQHIGDPKARLIRPCSSRRSPVYARANLSPLGRVDHHASSAAKSRCRPASLWVPSGGAHGYP